MRINMRLWAKIGSILSLIVTIENINAVISNYTLSAWTSLYFWLYLSVKVLPLLFLAVPLIYYGFRKSE